MAKKKKRAARKKTTSDNAFELRVPVEWYVPDDIKTYHATDVAIQFTGNDFVVSFFELRPPVILGSIRERVEQSKAIKSVRKQCITRVAVSVDRMPAFIKAFQKNLKSYQDQIAKKAKN